jgi:serine phosphatase RsbU (regulator of sigma subunit)/PAS domain-containing protein
LELIILAPVLAFLILAGSGVYFLILNSVQDFAARSIRQSFTSLSDGVYGIADREADRLSWTGHAGDPKRTTVRQVFALYDIENFARKFEIGVIVYSKHEAEAVLRAGMPADVTLENIESAHPKDKYILHTFEFKPWNWRITLVQESSAYATLLERTRHFYIAAALVLLVIAGFLIIYLRRTIARPIHQIVTRLRAGEPPEYKGIKEFEYLSQNLGQMMQEISEYRHHLEELVGTRTAELEEAQKQLRVALENMPGGMFMVDADLQIKVSNDQYPTMYGLPPELFQEDRSLRHAVEARANRGDYGPGAASELVRERLKGYTDREPLRSEEETHDGRIVEFFSTPTQDGGTVAVVIDISERKQAERDLAEKSGFIQLIAAVTRAANEAKTADEAMQITLDKVCAHTGWPIGHLYKFDAASNEMVPTAQWHVVGSGEFDAFRKITSEFRFAPGAGLPGRVFASRKPTWIQEISEDSNFPRATAAMDVGVKSAIGFPVLVGKEVAAVLEFFTDNSADPYEPLLDVMAQIGTQLGRAIERERAEERIRSDLELLQQELEAARDLQLAMVPSEFPPGSSKRPLQFAASMVPARNVGGDFYNVIEIDDRRTGIAIADVSGKGPRAALFMARSLTAFNSIARRGGSPKEVIKEFNVELSAENESEMYVTVFYGVYDTSNNLFTYVDAGHYPPLLRKPNGDVVWLEQVGGPMVGLMKRLSYDEQSLELVPGNTILCYTDGVIDAMNASGEQFSEARLKALLTGCGQLDASDLVTEVLEEIGNFVGDTPQIDDITCLVMRHLGNE